MRRALCAATFAAVAAGCSGPACPLHTFAEASEVLASYRDMRRPARVLRAEASVDRRDGDGRVRGTVLMFVERDDRVRFDAMTQFGAAAILTSDGERFALTDLRENEFFVGPTCEANIERLLGLRLSAAQVTRLLLGESPEIDAEARVVRCEGGRYRVTLRDADGRRQELELEVREADRDAPPEAQRMRLRRSEVFHPDGRLQWRVTYDDYRFVVDPRDAEGRGVVMPFTVRFEDPGNGADTRVRFERLDLNVEVPPDAFTQTPRPGLTVRHLGCE
ncbi:MAG: DUF4292 domain-containing protein [Sandaracinaceae bacterium]|nr:DUF4292 domain-containing protein [Sandaracinaceae bacterium]